MLWDTFTELNLTLVSQGCCLKGLTLLTCQDDKYLFLVVDTLVKYFCSRGKSTKTQLLYSITQCTWKMTLPENWWVNWRAVIYMPNLINFFLSSSRKKCLLTSFYMTSSKVKTKIYQVVHFFKWSQDGRRHSLPKVWLQSSQ